MYVCVCPCHCPFHYYRGLNVVRDYLLTAYQLEIINGKNSFSFITLFRINSFGMKISIEIF